MDFVNVQEKILCQQEINENAVNRNVDIERDVWSISLCVSVPLISTSSKISTCHASPFGCCKDNITISPTFDRRGCPGIWFQDKNKRVEFLSFLFVEYCSCHPTGSLRTSCDPKTSSCYCRPAVAGTRCSHCENEYWAFSRIVTHNNTGCTRKYD